MNSFPSKKLAAKERSKVIRLDARSHRAVSETIVVRPAHSFASTFLARCEQQRIWARTFSPREKGPGDLGLSVHHAAGERVSRSRLAAMLWDRTPDAQAHSSFRQALHELSLAMGPLANELISADRETVKLNSQFVLDRRDRHAGSGNDVGRFALGVSCQHFALANSSKG